MNISEQQKFKEELENIIYQLAELMLDIIRLTLYTLDDYQQIFEKNVLDDQPF